jgi:hypothetical protein
MKQPGSIAEIFEELPCQSRTTVESSSLRVLRSDNNCNSPHGEAAILHDASFVLSAWIRW